MLRIIAGISLLVVLSACGSSPKAHFYTLSSGTASALQTGNTNNQGVSVAVWTVTLPEYLRRPEIVTRNNQVEISLADFDRWAGNLDNNATQLIANELGKRLQSNQVVTSPWESYRQNDFQVKVHADRFDGALNGEVVFRGTWSLMKGKGKDKKEIVRQNFAIKEKAADPSYLEMVKALSKTTVLLAEQIANSISTHMHK